jgi:hypothetical protein
VISLPRSFFGWRLTSGPRRVGELYDYNFTIIVQGAQEKREKREGDTHYKDRASLKQISLLKQSHIAYEKISQNESMKSAIFESFDAFCPFAK